MRGFIRLSKSVHFLLHSLRATTQRRQITFEVRGSTFSITGDQDRPLIECNEGHALIITGKHDAAIRRLQQVAESPAVRPALAALEGMARAYLATGDLDECDAILRKYEEGVAKDPVCRERIRGPRDGRHAGKLLLRQRRTAEALAFVHELPRTCASIEMIDCSSHFWVRYKAEALAASGDISNASRQLVATAAAETIVTLDQYAHFCRAASVV